ncbi:Small glutamine-rich tetratricopeptide repeat-containing protein 2 [Lecanora helva]
MATTLDSKKRLALAICDFLTTSLKDGTLTAEDTESIEVATSCIADTFHVDPTNKAHIDDAIGSQSLLQIYSVYEKLKGKSTASTSGTSSATEGRPATPTTKDGAPSQPASSSAGPSATTPDSELYKSQGNAAMSRKDHATAITLYTKALSISPTNPIYLSNRAAAYSASSQHALAAADAELAVAADPKYTKAWSRLGLARFVLGDARASMEAYGKGIEYEGSGGSEAMKKGFKTAKEKVEEEEREEKEREDEVKGAAEDVDEAPGSTRAGAGGGGMPDLSALAGMFGGGGAGGGGGGMPDMSAIMNNPMFASMAQNLMSNPQALQGLMNNPQMRQMAERFGLGGGGGAGGGEGAGGVGGGAQGAGRGAGAGGGGGGMPDLASLMQDPSIAEM